jgi:hypothetical protein
MICSSLPAAQVLWSPKPGPCGSVLSANGRRGQKCPGIRGVISKLLSVDRDGVSGLVSGVVVL